MSRFKGYELVTVGIVSAFGIYSGTKFFEPIVIEQLKKDDNLRSDIAIPEYDAEGNPILPEQVQQAYTEALKHEQDGAGEP